MKTFTWIIIQILSIYLFSMFFLNWVWSEDNFVDVDSGQAYWEAISFMKNEWIIKWYPDWTFRPTNEIIRAEFLKIVLKSDPNFSEQKADDCLDKLKKLNYSYVYLKDVDTDLWFAPYVCYAYENKIIKGYEDWTFKPTDSVLFTEMSKMIAITQNLDLQALKKGDQWYVPYVQALYKKNAIAPSILTYWQKVNRWEMAESMFIVIKSKSKNNVWASSDEFLWMARINFDQDMDRESVESSLSVYPQNDLDLLWVSNKELKISLAVEDEDSRQYIINLNDKAKTKTWQALWKIISRNFKTSGQAKINFVSPEWEIKDLNKNITVRFNKPISVLTTFDSQSQCPIEISPPLPWKCVWITTSTFQYRPFEWFSIGAKYDIKIPDWIDTIAWDTTINSKSFEIITPKFELLNKNSSKLNKDEPLLVAFNANVSLNDFNSNFSIEWISKSNLIIDHFKNDKWKKVTNIISIFPKSKNWWYDKKYKYTIWSWLKSVRWNIALWKDYNHNFQIDSFLVRSAPFIYKDEFSKNKELSANFRYSINEKIIPKKDVNIAFSFYEDFPLNKALFNINVPDFDIKYIKKLDCTSWDCKVVDDKKWVIVEIGQSDISLLKVDIFLSKFVLSDNVSLSFNSRQYNKVIDYQFIDYNTSCISFSNPVPRPNFKNFDYWTWSRVNWMNKVYGSRRGDCKSKNPNTYTLSTRLNPDQDHTLIIKKQLLDNNNITLDKDYEFKFRTNKALNEDKHVNFVDSKKFILVPDYIDPLWIALRTINLDKVILEVCEGDFDIKILNYISNESCEKKELSINNLWFTNNFTVFDLNKIYWKQFTSSAIKVSVSKLEEEKTKYELKSTAMKSVYYLRSNISVVLKNASNKKILWLTDFKTWEDLNDEISSVTSFKEYWERDKYWNYVQKYKFENNVDVKFENDWIYSLNWSIWQYLVIKTRAWKELLISDVSRDAWIIGWNIWMIKTDRPLYKPWDRVYVKWFIRKQMLERYDVWSWSFDYKIIDQNRSKLKNFKVKLSSEWSFDFYFDLDKNAPLWTYRIIWGFNSTTFSVEHYEKPDFFVETETDKSAYLYWERAKASINAKYYIWMGLSWGQWTYWIIASDYNFDWAWIKWYIWWENNNPCRWCFMDEYMHDNTETIVYWKKFTLWNDGKKELYLDLINNGNSDAKDKKYSLSYTITDPNTKKSVSSSDDFVVLRSDIMVWMKTDKYSYDYWDEARLEFVTVNQKWEKRWNQGIRLKVIKLNYEKNPDTLRFEEKENELKNTLLKTNASWIANFIYKVNDSWKYRFEIAMEWKSYKTTKVIYVSGFNLIRPKDKIHDLDIFSSNDIYSLWEKAQFTISSPYKWVRALIVIQKLWWILDYELIDIKDYSQKYELNVSKKHIPWFTLSAFLVKSTWDIEGIIEELTSLRLEMKEIEDELYALMGEPVYIIYDLLPRYNIILPQIEDGKLDNNLLDNLSVLRKKESAMMQSLLPDYLLWEVYVKVNLDSIKLNTKINLDKNSYLPWESVSIVFDIKDSFNKPLDWELNVAIVDKALLALKADSSKSIYDIFYTSKKHNLRFSYNMIKLIKRLEFEKELDSSDNSFEYEDSGIMQKWWRFWVGENLSMAQPQGVSADWSIGWWSSSLTKIRKDFKDLAFYQATVKVKNGKAYVTVPKLPDDLTTWMIKWFVFTRDTKLWDFEKDFITVKPVSTINSIPRFFNAWDKAQLTTVIVNDTNNALNWEASLFISNASNLIAKKPISLKAKSSTKVTWDIEVDWMKDDINWDDYKSKINIKVVVDWLSDEVELIKKISPYSTPEYTFTNWSTEDSSYEEKIILPDYIDKSQWKLDIAIWSNILTNLTDNLSLSWHVSIWNSYSIINDLYKWAVLTRLFNEINSKDKIDQIRFTDIDWISYKLKDLVEILQKFQQSDWWFSHTLNCKITYYNKTCSSFQLTASALNTFSKLKQSWIVFDEKMLSWALNYYKKEIDKLYKENKNRIGNNLDSFLLLSDFKETVFINKYLEKDYSKFSNLENVKMLYILQRLNIRPFDIDKLVHKIKNATIIEARWTLLPNSKQYSISNISSTALALKTFISSNIDEKLLVENFARWLVSQKDRGIYGSSYESILILDVITDYIKYTWELDNISFVAKGYLNWKSVIENEFNEKNMFDIKKDSFDFENYIHIWIAKENSLWFEKTWKGKLYYDVWLRYFLPIDKIMPRDEWLIVSRSYYKFDDYSSAYVSSCSNYEDYPSYLRPFCWKTKIKDLTHVSSANQWDVLVVEVKIIVPHERNNVVVNSFIPAWSEIANTSFDTVSDEIKNVSSKNSWWYYWGWFDYTQIKDDRVILFAKHLRAWEYTYTYVIKLNHKWTYHLKPTTAELLEKPEIWGRSEWAYFDIK